MNQKKLKELRDKHGDFVPIKAWNEVARGKDVFYTGTGVIAVRGYVMIHTAPFGKLDFCGIYKTKD